jgi:hypothetical protein
MFELHDFISLCRKSWDSAVGIATGYGLRAGRPKFDSRQEQEIFLYSKESRLALEPTQPPIQWVPGALFWGEKRSGRKADHSPASSAEIKNGGPILLPSHEPSWHSA